MRERKSASSKDLSEEVQVCIKSEQGFSKAGITHLRVLEAVLELAVEKSHTGEVDGSDFVGLSDPEASAGAVETSRASEEVARGRVIG